MKPILKKISLTSQSGSPASAIRMGEGLAVELEFDCGSLRLKPNINLCVKNNYVPVFTASTRVQKQYQVGEAISAGTIRCEFHDLPLLEGTYSIDAFFGDEYQSIDVIYDAISFEVLPVDVFGSGQVPNATEGTIYWPAVFDVREQGTNSSAHTSTANAR
jgi:lipopolysaccharide transport system ATP-binding protein